MKFDKTLLKRDDKAIQKILFDSKGEINISSPLYIIFPERFIVSNLAKITSEIEISGAVLVMNDKHIYTVITLPNLLSFSPSSIESIDVEDKPHMILEFLGHKFINSTKVLDSDSIPVQIIDEFFIQNNCPFYLSSTDLIGLLSKIPLTTTSHVIFDNIVIELLISLVVKTKDGKKARDILSKEEMASISKTSISGISNVASFTNNISRIGGSYFNDGLTYGLDDNDSESTELDDIYRK